VSEYKNIYQLLWDRGVGWVKKGNIIMLYKRFPCPHPEPKMHIHYYIIDISEYPEDNPWKLSALLDWLDYGFWNDSGIAATIEGYREIERRFLQYRCPGAIQNF
jgi:hypothetical protein